MPYVQRDPNNKIIGIYANLQAGYALEYVENPTLDTPKTYQPLSAFQVRKVLTQFNLRSQVETAVSQADQATKDAWQYTNDFQRDNPVLTAMATLLGLTDDQLDQMFEIGVTL